MVKLREMKLGFRTNPNNSLCLDHVWDVTHIIIALEGFHDFFLEIR